ncbi:MAG: BMP family ABC transporter substrate-binding protein [Actinomycetota bacterium]|nr:BMP family ABC transporter substrate-binding protein [Actinomycetota bacterium]
MPKWLRMFALPVVALSLIAAACGNDEPADGGGEPTDGAAAECSADIKVGVALDVGGLGDNGFNDLAKAGLDKAIADGLVCEENTEFIEANSEGTNLDENTQSLAEGGFDVVIGNGFAFSPGINAIALDYPDVSFGIIDGYATCGTACGLDNDADAIPNVRDIAFQEEQGSYLVGVAAGLKATELDCDTVGFLGGQTGPLIAKFEAGYAAGVEASAPGVKVLVGYIGDTTKAFDDISGGEALANKLFDDGSCITYHAAGDAGNGLFKAAAEQEKIAIGVDSDQHEIVSADQAQWIMTSMIKRVDTAVYDTIVAVGDGSFEGGGQVYGLEVEGISYATSNPDLMGPDIVDAVEEAKQQILDGEIEPPTEP